MTTYNLDLCIPPNSVLEYPDRMRVIRNQLLTASDWTVLPDSPTNQTAWATYRQALRDFPITWNPSSLVDFPDPPE